MDYTDLEGYEHIKFRLMESKRTCIMDINVSVWPADNPRAIAAVAKMNFSARPVIMDLLSFHSRERMTLLTPKVGTSRKYHTNALTIEAYEDHYHRL